jgi:hypothetical protein
MPFKSPFKKATKPEPKAEPKQQAKPAPDVVAEQKNEKPKSENRKPSDRMVRIKNVTCRNLFVDGETIPPGDEADVPVRVFLNFADRAEKV